MTPTSHPNRYIQTLFQLYNNSGISTDPLYSCIQTLSQISPKNTSTYCSPPHQVLLPSPWCCLFTIINSYSMPLISISIVLSSWTLFLFFFYSFIITTHAHFSLQTLFFSTHINMSCMYQYSLSLILKLFLSYSFVLSSQSLNLIITTNFNSDAESLLC